MKLRAVSAILIATAWAVPALAQPVPWSSPALAPDARAKLLLAAMTASEKITLVHGTGAGAYIGHVAGIPRLGVPDLNLEDGPAGVADAMTQVTGFPAPITVGASWDLDLAERLGAAMAAEQGGKGTNVVLGPTMNIDRVPAGGRNFEGFGEDPFLAGQMAAAVVRGIQRQGLIATAKHYIDNDQETQRTTISSVIDDRTQHEIYLPPFAACVAAGVGAVMCSYNRVNGTYACEDGATQNGWLKGELGYRGWIMSDWGATHSTGLSANHGLDMEMPGSTYFGPLLASAVAGGSVDSTRVDDMVVRVLTAMFAAGLFDRPPAGSPDADVRSDDHTLLARQGAAQGLVLLKNDGNVLPLASSTVHSIAVIGAAADGAPVFQGLGSSRVVASGVVTPLVGISARAGASVSVAYAAGSAAPFGDAAALAAQSDVAVVVVGVTSGEGTDRSSLSLSAPADALITAVLQANPRTIAVVYAPAQVTIPWADGVGAILFGGLAGQEHGDALADVLFGDTNPSAKLPMTFARSAADYPASSVAQFPGSAGQAVYGEGLDVGYRAFDARGLAPLFPFGHGLSYTTFDYANLVVSPAVIAAGDAVQIAFDLANAGGVAGAEVDQLYLALPPEASEPPLRLAAFSRVALDAGAAEHVTFSLDPSAYSFFSAGRGGWVAYPGRYLVHVGSSSRDIRLDASFVVQGGPLAGTVHQAEEAAVACGAAVQSDGSGFTGAGYVGGYSTVGASTSFEVDMPGDGSCALTARYSASDSPRTLSLHVNGSKVRQIVFRPLANPTTWDFETEMATLRAGANEVAYVADPGDTGDVRLDAFIDCVPTPGNDDSGADGGTGAGQALGAGVTGHRACPPPVPLSGAPLLPPASDEGWACKAGPSTAGTAGPSLGVALALAGIGALARRRRSSRQ
jgi:beta-glucosidase